MRKVLFRFLGYTVVVALVTAALLVFADRMPGGLYFDYSAPGVGIATSEFSPVEVLQNAILIICSAAFGWIAARDRVRRPMALGFCILFLVFLVRELDFFLDFYIVDNLWQVLCGVMIAFILVYCLRDRDRYVQGWRRSWPSAGLALIIGGLIVLIPYAQLVGHEALWESVLGDRYVRVIKVAVEEFVELGAYAMIATGTAEFLYAWSRLPRTRTIEARRR